uniref:Uncharacterized protein n=1 Tax=Rhizophora mucronata TaxID=61149 RepID=A0A2P2PH01_RHIMU
MLVLWYGNLYYVFSLIYCNSLQCTLYKSIRKYIHPFY